MKRNTKGGWIALGVLAGAVLGGLGLAYSGAYNVAADDPHTRPVYALMETVRKRSIAARAADLTVPGDLSSEARIRQGAGNYNAMCMGCHLAPGMGETELSRGLYPKPPNLTKETVDAATAFWVIKHGIKASGMPAWGESMEDAYVWNMAAFLQRLPKLDADGYQALVASSGGHSHGGNETEPHGHADGAGDDHHDAPSAGASHPHPPGTPPHDDAPADPHAGMDMGPAEPQAAAAANKDRRPETTAPAKTAAPPATTTHRHADGTVESHPATPPAHDDDHNHPH